MGRREAPKKKVGVGNIIKIVFFLITIPLLILACIIMYKANKYPDKVPDVFGIKPMIVLSGSMETSIFTGDLVFVKMIDADLLKEQDIIAFRNEEDTVTTHRIVEIVEQNGEVQYRTKGDNNSTNDLNLVKQSAVEGIYVSRIPNVGNFLMFMQEPMGLGIVLLIILAIGLIGLHILNKIEDKELSEEDKKLMKEFEEFKRMKNQSK